MAHLTCFLFFFTCSHSFPILPIPLLPSPAHPTQGIGKKWAKKRMAKGSFHVDVKSFWQPAYRVFRDRCAPASSSSRWGHPRWGWPLQPEPPSSRVARFGGSQALGINQTVAS